KRETGERTPGQPSSTASTYQRYDPDGSALVIEVASSVSAICTNGARSSEAKTRWRSLSGTAPQTRVTGAVTFVAPLTGATSSGALTLQRGGSGILNVSLFDATAGQPSKRLSTNQMPFPAPSLRVSCVAVVTPSEANGSLLIE